MDQAAADDAERERNRVRLYAPPAGTRSRRAGASAPVERGVSRAKAAALMAQLDAEDAQFRQGRAR